MKVLLDTSFLRHIDLVGQTNLIRQIHNSLSWDFSISTTIFNELRTGGINSRLQLLLDDQIITIESCGNQKPRIYPRALSLDPGELEIICIIDQCEDRTFKEYLILIDDHQAQKTARDLGMSSHDILVFLFLCNRNNLLQKL